MQFHTGHREYPIRTFWSRVEGEIVQKTAVKKAAKIGGEWRDSKKKFIKKAKAAASKKDYKKAIKLANKAKFEGDAGYTQAMAEKDAKPWLF